jgi:hypothetical protein
MTAVVGEAVTVADLVAAVRRRQPSLTPRAEPGPGWSADCIGVLGAHPGAGATAVAVALVDALGTLGHRPTLVDLAPAPDAFGAAECEVDSGRPGWRAGRRGTARVLRRSDPAAAVIAMPGPTVVDGARPGPERQILVCRTALPSIRRAESACREAAAIAVVGARRWPKPLAASLGPALAAAADAGRVVFVPHSRELQLNGVDAEPTPARVLAGGIRLAELIWPDLAQTPSRHRRRGRRR